VFKAAVAVSLTFLGSTLVSKKAELVLVLVLGFLWVLNY